MKACSARRRGRRGSRCYLTSFRGTKYSRPSPCLRPSSTWSHHWSSVRRRGVSARIRWSVFRAERGVLRVRVDHLLLRYVTRAICAGPRACVSSPRRWRELGRRGRQRVVVTPSLASRSWDWWRAPFIALVPAMAIIVLHTNTAWLVTAQRRWGGHGGPDVAITLEEDVTTCGLARFDRGPRARARPLTVFPPNPASAFIILFFLGGAYMGTLSGLNVSVQLHAPRAIGRAFSRSTRCRLSLFIPWARSSKARSRGTTRCARSPWSPPFSSWS